MTKLAESSGTVVYEDGNKLYISKRPATWTTVFLFITGLLAFILLTNGVLQFVVFESQARSSKIGTTLIGVGLVFTILLWRVWIYHKKIKAISPRDLKIICVFDFENNKLLDVQRNILSPLHLVWIERKMQISSSSPELLLRWDRGYLSIVKGSPFSGGIAGIEKVLLSKGIKRK